MDAQLKKGMLDVCVLAAIKDKESYGYEMIKDISPYVIISESTLYPVLRRLESMHFLTVRSIEYNGRLRKYYKITEEGKERLRVFANEWEEMIRIYKFVTGEGKVNE